MKKFLFDCGSRDATPSLGFLALRVMVSRHGSRSQRGIFS